MKTSDENRLFFCVILKFYKFDGRYIDILNVSDYNNR